MRAQGRCHPYNCSSRHVLFVDGSAACVTVLVWDSQTFLCLASSTLIRFSKFFFSFFSTRRRVNMDFLNFSAFYFVYFDLVLVEVLKGFSKAQEKNAGSPTRGRPSPYKTNLPGPKCLSHS